MLGGAKAAQDLGEDYGATLTEAEVRWLVEREWARTAQDVVWRRSKLGLRMAPEEVDRLDAWMRDFLGARTAGDMADPPPGVAAIG